MYPVMLDLEGRRCLVVGGGGVALRKISGLVEEGARVTAVAPAPCEPLARLAAEGAISLEQRPYRDGEAAGYALVFAATDVGSVNARVAADAEAAGIWVNVADQTALCGFQLPGRIRRGPLAVAVGSSGRAPFAVRRLRQLLERHLGPEWSQWSEVAGRYRDAVRALPLSARERQRRYDRFFERTVRVEGRLAARVPTQAEQDSWLDPVASGAELCLAPPPVSAVVQPGLISLVGAGPGDPLLLTLRARRRLLSADAVVYDRLAAPVLPPDLPGRVRLHCVAKSSRRHPVPQPAICELLVRLAREGQRVVRLKGGDPFVFGRGGEEAEALAEAGVPFELVPGVSAAMGAGACAGIPLTYRRDSSTLVFVTAHQASGCSGVDWEQLAAMERSTLVGFMGLRRLPGVVARLLAAGMHPDTPAAMVSWATTPSQRLVQARLGALPAAVAEAGLTTPAIFFIGPVAARASRLGWFASRPLSGLRLAVAGSGAALGEALEVLGAQLLEVPLPIGSAARVALGSQPLHGWLLRCPDQVQLLAEDELGLAGPVALCLGAEAAAAARALGSCEVMELADDAGVEQVVQALRMLRWSLGTGASAQALPTARSCRPASVGAISQ